jgi:hypothetical protein
MKTNIKNTIAVFIMTILILSCNENEVDPAPSPNFVIMTGGYQNVTVNGVGYKSATYWISKIPQQPGIRNFDSEIKDISSVVYKKTNGDFDYYDVYSAGYQNNGSVDIACYWLNMSYNPLPCTQNTNTRAYGIATPNAANVYIVGTQIDVASGQTKGVYWLNGVQTILSTIDNQNTTASAIYVDNGDVYIAGTIFNTDRTKAVYWKNNEIFELPTSNNYTHYAHDIIYKNQTVYVAGYESHFEGNTEKSVAKYWKNNTIINVVDRQNSSKGYAICLDENDNVLMGGLHVPAGDIVAEVWINGYSRFFAPNSFNSVIYGMTYVNGKFFYAGFGEGAKAKQWENNQGTELITSGTSGANAIHVITY